MIYLIYNMDHVYHLLKEPKSKKLVIFKTEMSIFLEIHYLFLKNNNNNTLLLFFMEKKYITTIKHY